MEVSKASVPAISVAMYEAIVAQAAEKYNGVLKQITPKFMKESVDKFREISFVNRKPFEVNVLVTQVEGRKVTFWITFDLYGPAHICEALLNYLWRSLPISSGIRVENGSFVGTVVLRTEPCQVTNIATRRTTYFLSDREVKSLMQPIMNREATSAAL